MRSKYGSRRTQVSGERYQSKGEAERHSELQLLEKAGEIRDLQRHPRFVLMVNGHRIGAYTPDFGYVDMTENPPEDTIEEYKGSRKAMSRDAPLRMKLFYALHPQYRFVVYDSKLGCVEFGHWIKPKGKYQRTVLDPAGKLVALLEDSKRNRG